MSNLETTSVGHLLRAWRTARGKSQLSLSLEAGISTRHLSFIETGRSNPSREMVRTLTETLDVPLRDRNLLMEAAGYAAFYRETPLDAASMEHVRAALSQILRGSEPNPTLVVNRRYDVLMANEAAHQLITHFRARADEPPRAPNMARLVVSPHGLRPFLVNWDEVAAHVIDRLRRELAGSANRDDEDEALLAEVLAAEPSRRAPAASPPPEAIVVPVQLRRGDLVMSLFTTITTLGTPLDITLQELRIETLFPADAASKAALLRLTASALPPG
jgi:transcriptional regulator with XRE-family HTH domain